MITFTRRTAELPVFADMIRWLALAGDVDWGSAFTLRFCLQDYYRKQADREVKQQYSYGGSKDVYLELSDYVECYVRGVWDKGLFYKAVFLFSDLGCLLEPVSTVEQNGAVSSRMARVYALNSFFGYQAIKPLDGKYHFDSVREEMPKMAFAHELYGELIPLILGVELKRGEQPTPFSEYIHKIRVVYGIDYMIQILTALGKEPLERGFHYYSSDDCQQDRI